MEYGKIIAVTGLSGLFELLTSKNDGAIVRSLEDNSTRFVATRVHNFSQLESIEVFTTRENVNLIEIFQAIEKSTDALPDVKKANDLKAYFNTVFPQLDQERVYTSDMKKMIKWFELLKKNAVEFKLTAFDNADQEEQVEEEGDAPAKKTKSTKEETVGTATDADDKKPVKAKAATGKAADKETEPKAKTKKTDAKSAGEEPKKKAAKKKNTDD